MLQEDAAKLVIDSYQYNPKAKEFCDAFISSNQPRYIFGCNEWAEDIASKVKVDGFVDDFRRGSEFLGSPVIRSRDLPRDALVVSAVVLGRPLTAQRKIEEHGAHGIDYYTFQKYSEIPLKPVLYLEEFSFDFDSNRQYYEKIFLRFEDMESRRIFCRLINFRLSCDLRYMEGFVDAQDRQYFEPFLNLNVSDEIFADVGCFDGYTSTEFAKRCPDYQAIHVFEPESSNMENVKKRLGAMTGINYHSVGASDAVETLKFKKNGSASTVSEDGDSTITVMPIDSVLNGKRISYLKMDIEGGEAAAIRGSRDTILKHHPRLAISVYHKVSDLWKIPELVFSIRDDYKLYIRHYTEGVTETVMFFIPNHI